MQKVMAMSADMHEYEDSCRIRSGGVSRAYITEHLGYIWVITLARA